jgi:hypothetical protein
VPKSLGASSGTFTPPREFDKTVTQKFGRCWNFSLFGTSTWQARSLNLTGNSSFVTHEFWRQRESESQGATR